MTRGNLKSKPHFFMKYENVVYPNLKRDADGKFTEVKLTSVDVQDFILDNKNFLTNVPAKSPTSRNSLSSKLKSTSRLTL